MTVVSRLGTITAIRLKDGEIRVYGTRESLDNIIAQSGVDAHPEKTEGIEAIGSYFAPVTERELTMILISLVEME